MKIKILVGMASCFLFCIPTISFSQSTTTQIHTTTVTTRFIEPSRFELGFMFGNMRSSRALDMESPFGPYNASQSKNNYETGLQFKWFLHSVYDLRTFLFINAVNVYDSTNTLFEEMTFPIPSLNSIVQLKTNFVGRIGFGLETDPFDNFTMDIGAGLAVIHQQLIAQISEFSYTTNSVTNNSLAPSIMGSLNYKLCSSCLSGHPFIISGQLSAEQYPNLRLTTVTSFGDYQSNMRAGWQYHADLVLSTRF